MPATGTHALRAPRTRRRVVVLPTLLILLVTLMPASAPAEPEPRVCIACGDGIVADALLNIVLFVPFGAALALAGAAAAMTFIAGCALSAAIEVVQLWIPGRYTTLSDVAANTAGAGLGWLLAHRAAVLARWRGRGGALAMAAAALPVMAIAATALLLVPALPADALYFGQWMRALPGRPAYDGALLDARIGVTTIPPRGVPIPGATVARALLHGEPLILEGAAGSHPAPRAPIFSLATRRHELLFVAAHGNDAVLRLRSRATAIGLQQPELRLRDAFRDLPAGSAFRFEARRHGRGWCMALNDYGRCGLALSAAHGWAFLKYPTGLPAAVEAAFGWLWLALLTAPAGFLARPRLRWPTLASILAASLAVAAASPYLAGVPTALLAPALGFVGGALLPQNASRPVASQPQVATPGRAEHGVN